MDQIVRDPGVVGMPGKLLFQDRGCPGISRVSLIGLRLRARDIERTEYLGLVVVRVFRRERLVGLGAGELPRAFGTVGEILVVGAHRLQVVALSLGLRAHVAALVDRGLRQLRALE